MTPPRARLRTTLLGAVTALNHPLAITFDAQRYATCAQVVYDWVDSLEAVTALNYSLATTFPRRLYGPGAWHASRLASPAKCKNADVRQLSALFVPRAPPRLVEQRHAWRVQSVQHLLCMPLHPAYSRHLPPTAESRGQSLQELGLAPQAVLLMQQEDD